MRPKEFAIFWFVFLLLGVSIWAETLPEKSEKAKTLPGVAVRTEEFGVLKGSEAYVLFSKRAGDSGHFIDKFVNKEVDPQIKFSLWRNRRHNVLMNFGAQTLIAPNYTSNFLISIISFQAGFDHYLRLDSAGRYRLRSFLVHRSQHTIDLARVKVKIPARVNQDLRENVFGDLNILGAGVERAYLADDRLRYNFRAYVQPFNSKFPGLWESDTYPRALFVDGEVFPPLPFLNEHLSFYGSGELGKSSVGTVEARFYPVKNLALFLKQGFISNNHEAVVTPHQGIVYRGWKFGTFIKIGNLFNWGG